MDDPGCLTRTIAKHTLPEAPEALAAQSVNWFGPLKPIWRDRHRFAAGKILAAIGNCVFDLRGKDTDGRGLGVSRAVTMSRCLARERAMFAMPLWAAPCDQHPDMEPVQFPIETIDSEAMQEEARELTNTRSSSPGRA